MSACVKRWRLYRVPACAAALLCCAMSLAEWEPNPGTVTGTGTVSSGGRRAGQEGGEVGWRRFGENVMKTLPEKVKDGTDVDRVRHVAAQVGKRLAELGIEPNTNAVERMESRAEHALDATVGTCDDVSTKLIAALEGAGVSAKYLTTYKFYSSDITERDGMTSDERLALETRQMMAQLNAIPWWDVNHNHGAVFIHVEGKPYVIDLWYHGKDTGSFDNAETSAWNVIPLSDWEDKLRRDGYVLFSTDAGTSKYASSPRAVRGIVEEWSTRAKLETVKRGSRKGETPEERRDRVLREYCVIYRIWGKATALPGHDFKVEVCAEPDGTGERYRVKGGKYENGQKLSGWDLLLTLQDIEFHLQGHKEELEKLGYNVSDLLREEEGKGKQ